VTVNYDPNYENSVQIDDAPERRRRRVVPSGTLNGDRVRNPAGEDLGKIEEIMIDIPTGRVAYAVIAFGGVMGIGEKLFAVPWSALSLNERDHEFILDLDRRRMEESPGFDPNHWPDMADPAWEAQADEPYSPHHRSPHS
jgi:sporulation protein YlmC with PRC-barrel domain